MKMSVTFKCPYCEMSQVVHVDIENPYSNFYTVYCNMEDGGCDLPVTLQVFPKAHVTVYKLLEIENE